MQQCVSPLLPIYTYSIHPTLSPRCPLTSVKERKLVDLFTILRLHSSTSRNRLYKDTLLDRTDHRRLHYGSASPPTAGTYNKEQSAVPSSVRTRKLFQFLFLRSLSSTAYVTAETVPHRFSSTVLFLSFALVVSSAASCFRTTHHHLPHLPFLSFTLSPYCA